MKLSNIKRLGRYKNTETNKSVNIHMGRNTQRGTDQVFYFCRGKRIFITANDFYGEEKKYIPA